MDTQEAITLTQMELENAKLKNYPRKLEWAQLCLDALALMQKQEQGLVVELPCKVDNEKLDEILKFCSNNG